MYIGSMSEATLDSASAVVAALGGPTKVARLTGRTPQQVWTWKTKDRFPGWMYRLMQDELEALGKSAPARLWGQIEGSKVPGA
jgi:hypothetical protein